MISFGKSKSGRRAVEGSKPIDWPTTTKGAGRGGYEWQLPMDGGLRSEQVSGAGNKYVCEAEEHGEKLGPTSLTLIMWMTTEDAQDLHWGAARTSGPGLEKLKEEIQGGRAVISTGAGLCQQADQQHATTCKGFNSTWHLTLTSESDGYSFTSIFPTLCTFFLWPVLTQTHTGTGILGYTVPVSWQCTKTPQVAFFLDAGPCRYNVNFDPSSANS